MPTITIICIGKMNGDPLAPAWDNYARRIRSPLEVMEVEGRSSKEELEKLRAKIVSSKPLIALDEKGESLPSIVFADKTGRMMESGQGGIQFVIGGAGGLDDLIRANAALLLSFGRQTWPHLLARVMLIEQIYRAQQIWSNHPYHREG